MKQQRRWVFAAAQAGLFPAMLAFDRAFFALTPTPAFSPKLNIYQRSYRCGDRLRHVAVLIMMNKQRSAEAEFCYFSSTNCFAAAAGGQTDRPNRFQQRFFFGRSGEVLTEPDDLC